MGRWKLLDPHSLTQTVTSVCTSIALYNLVAINKTACYDCGILANTFANRQA